MCRLVSSWVGDHQRIPAIDCFCLFPCLDGRPGADGAVVLFPEVEDTVLRRSTVQMNIILDSASDHACTPTLKSYLKVPLLFHVFPISTLPTTYSVEYNGPPIQSSLLRSVVEILVMHGLPWQPPQDLGP